MISQNKLNREKQKNFDKEGRKIKNLVEKSELQIELLEAEIKRKEEMLQNLVQFKKQLESGNIFEEYGNLKLQLEKEVERWAQFSADLEDFEQGKRVRG